MELQKRCRTLKEKKPVATTTDLEASNIQPSQIILIFNLTEIRELSRRQIK
jgi:hypothetical protein